MYFEDSSTIDTEPLLGAEMGTLSEIAELPADKPMDAETANKMKTLLLKQNDMLKRQASLTMKYESLLRVNDVQFNDIKGGASLDEVTKVVDEATMAFDKGDMQEFMELVLDAMTDSRGESVIPSVEVRFSNLTVSAQVEVGDDGIPTVGKTLTNMATFMCKRTEYRERILLNNVSGVLKPGRMTLVLGPPGSGKSTFMRALSNKLAGNGVDVSGDVLYNGCPAGETDFVMSKVVGYISQVDTHIAQLTVRETFLFSWICMTGGSQGIAIGDELANEDKARELFAHVGNKCVLMIKILGLLRCADTVVGNDLLRGVSGGQKKRVTIGEMLMGTFRVLFADEITTGLDASTAYDIIKTMRATTDVFKLNFCCALLQPAPEVFNLFDDVLLLDRGYVVYHGQREGIIPFFASMGFYCPPRKDVADYLQEVTTDEGNMYLMPEGERAAQGLPPAPTSTAGFVECFQKTEEFKHMQAQLVADWIPQPQLAEMEKEFVNSWSASFRLCLVRMVKLIKRDPIFSKARIVQQIVMGLLVGCLFYQLDYDDFASRYSVFFITLMNFSVGAIVSIQLAFDVRNVYYRQRDASFYPTSAFMMAWNLSLIPVQVFETMTYCSLVYCLSGLSMNNGGYHLFFFCLVCFAMSTCLVQCFRVLSGLVTSFTVAVPFAATANIFFTLLSGFVISPEDIPAYWKWLYWVNPVGWAMRSLVQNEFLSDKYQTESRAYIDGDDGDTYGDVYLDYYGFPTDKKWLWMGVYVNLCFAAVAAIAVHYTYELVRFTRTGTVASEEDKAEDQRPSVLATGEQPSDVGLSKSRMSQQAYHDSIDGVTADSLALPFTPCTFAWKNVSYVVPLPTKRRFDTPETLQLLTNVSGYCKPYTTMALMGESGAGKTTLLDVLGGRKTSGTITGDICVNGYPLDKITFTRMVGYVEQQDIHSAGATVREALRFSGRLRLPSSVDEETLNHFVDGVLETLELTPLQHAMIGTKELGGLSVEQMKRLTIGVEFVANPSVLMLDEPTSGLDARAALIVMRAIKRTAATGRTVICTIHQPSSFIFESFDTMLLLRRGGRTVYAGNLGKDSCELIEYLQAIPGVQPIGPGENPAVWMLESIGAGASAQRSVGTFDFAEYYHLSRARNVYEQTLNADGVTRPGAEPAIVLADRYAASFYVQTMENLHKTFTLYWRNPNYNVVRMGISVVVAGVFGSMYFQQDYDDFSSATSRVAVIYMTTVFQGMTAANTVMPITNQERAVFYRERMSNMYSATSYGIAVGVVEFPYLVLVNLIFVVVFYSVVGLNPDAGAIAFYYIYFFLYMTAQVFLGQLLVCLLPNMQSASVLSSLLSNIFNMFGGFLIEKSKIPNALIGIYWVDPMHYAFEGMIVTQFKGDDTIIKYESEDGGDEQQTMDDWVSEQYPSLDYEHRWTDVAALIGFVLVYRALTFYALNRVNHLQR